MTMKKASLAVTAAILFGLAGVAQQAKPKTAEKAAKPEKFIGRVSDAKCGNNVDAACNKQCFDQEEAPVLVLDDSGQVLTTKKADELKKYPGAHVQVTGTKDGDVLTVGKITPVK